ncbi:MAG: hypothetical protein GXP30_06125 [Verrucomicrobia bacterium]|nr:hypothetical protein [Verrucomicrobiota bacterium]
MKKLTILVIILFAGFAAWQHFAPQMKEKYGEKATETAKNKDEKPAAKVVEKKPEPKVKPVAKKPVKKEVAKTKEVPMSKTDALIAKRYPMPNIKPLVEIVDNWNRVPTKAYPKQVTLKQEISFQLVVAGQAIGATKVKPGQRVAPLRLIGESLQVASLANRTMTSRLPVDQTDFKEQVTSRYDSFVAKITDQVHSNRAKAKKHLADHPELAMKFSGVEKGWDNQNDPRFAPVKSSLAEGEVKAVQLNEAKQFRWNGSEKINGDKYRGTYDTVSVKFEVKTIFGVFPNEFKCLLQAGRVVGWIDPLTMEEKI